MSSRRSNSWLVAMVLCWASILNFAAAAAPTAAPATAAPLSEETLAGTYRLGGGDRISVLVYGEPELSKEYALSPSGAISFPFLEEVQVVGMTAREVGERLATDLRGAYLIDPKVTVTVVRYRPIYINGEVKTPGAKDYEPGLTVRQAISLAGGLTDRASVRKIYLVGSERTAGQKPRKVDMDYELRPGDTVTIEESFF